MTTAPAVEVVRVKFRGPLGRFMIDRTPFIDLEGALNCGKTTACLWKELRAAWEWWPGIWSFIGRFSGGDNESKLIPAWERILDEAGLNSIVRWNPKELWYEFPNGPASVDRTRNGGDAYIGGSRVHSFGLQSPDKLRRYAKLRGLGVSRLYIDQAEELPPDFFAELVQRLRQPGFPHQLTLSPNPLDLNSWLATEFPENDARPNRKYYSVSLFDNAHNLPPDKVETALATWPVTHAKHRSAVLGKRGLNVIGTPVYGGAFTRALHVRPIAFNPAMPLEEGLDFGKHHPCYLVRQRSPYGGVSYLAGIMGQSMYLEDFLPVVKQFRSLWFPNAAEVVTCCDPAGSHNNSQGVRSNGVSVLKDHGFFPVWREESNQPSVRNTIMERIAGQMRRRTPAGEAYGINDDASRWLRVSSEGMPPASWQFLTDGDEAGYVWDENLVSQGSKQYRKARKDGWYEHGQNAKEYLELNFGSEPVPVPAPAVEPYKPRSTWG